jgi:hypothetical protein
MYCTILVYAVDSSIVFYLNNMMCSASHLDETHSTSDTLITSGNALKCTYDHLYFKKIFRVYTLGPPLKRGRERISWEQKKDGERRGDGRERGRGIRRKGGRN